ncbi:MAG TPA: Rap1a/Tai family immunity protein [Allosphingosinicella sp.]|nr:Rap1a/Tai family immunity protein [Allosphingosinicella sp.]
MRRITMSALSALLLTAAAQPPAAKPPAAQATIPTRLTAKLLSDLCAQDRAACLGYVVGSTDSWAGALAAAGRPQVICIPAGVTNDQITQVTVRYVRAHPEEGGVNAAVVIFAALKSAFPCGY